MLRGGGGHIALNYLASIGKMLQESGLEDVFIESGLYGSSSAMALLQGKSYNKGIKGHKLIMEVLLRFGTHFAPGLVKEDVKESKAKKVLF